MANAPAKLGIMDKFYIKFCKSPGKMLLHTGVIGWMLSSAAQIFAIAINDKISNEQKMFMIPQEAADACVNIISFYAVTRTFTAVAKKLVQTGKWIQQPTKKWLIKKGYGSKIGKIDFNISDLKLPSAQRRRHELFQSGIDLAAATAGGILSCNIITPIVRNLYASERQKTSLTHMNNKEQKNNVLTKKDYYKRLTMAEFASLNSGSLKI